MINDNSFLKAANVYEKKFDFLMSPMELDGLRFGAATPEKLKILEQLNNKINEIVSQTKIEIFSDIIKNKEEQKENRVDLAEEEINSLTANFAVGSKLIDLPEEVIGKILRPMNKEVRQMIYVQRDKISVEKAKELHHYWNKDVVTVFHVSDRELKDNEFRAGDKDNAVYFSTDIKRLFNLKDAKYIYAFRISKKTADISVYGALDCFGKLELKNGQGIEVEDKIKIFDEKDLSYRKKTMDSLGAAFDTTYQPAKDSIVHFMKSNVDNDDAYSLRA